MSFISKLFSPRKASNTLAGSFFRFPLGTSSAGAVVTERSAMQLTAVYACVRILAEGIASLPLNLYQREEEGSKAKAFEHPLYRLLHDAPNPEMTSFTFRETLMTHLLLWGNAYAQVIRNGRGDVIALYPLMPNRMTVDRDTKTGQIFYTYQMNESDATRGKETTVVLPREQVLHVLGLGFDGLVGFSPIGLARNALGLATATEEYGAKFFANGATPGGILEFPGVVKDPKALSESWSKGFSNANAHKVAILEEGAKYTPITVSPEEAQFLETRKFQIDEIARLFRIPPHMIGDLEKSSFSNIEQQSLEFVTYTLSPWIVKWEQSLNMVLLNERERDQYFFKFNVDGLLRGDYQSRMNGYAIGIQNGFMSPNDVRRLEHMDLIPDELGGNRYLCNGNMMSIADAGKQYDSGAGAGEEPDQTDGTGSGDGSGDSGENAGTAKRLWQPVKI